MTAARAQRGLLAALAVLIVVGLSAAPAGADAPRPTDYRSTVTRVTPELPAGAEVRVVGGDSLLELTMPRGHTAVVADYPGSDDRSTVPYLRFDADGKVSRNTRAVATAANEARYGTADRVPDTDAEPVWEVVATDGSYAWHDHRIHWMSPTAPRVVARDGQVDLGGPDGTWSVPVTIDDTPTVITGELVLAPPPSLAAWCLLAGLVVVVTVGVGLRWGQRAGAGLGAVTGAAAVLTAWSTWQAVPAGAGASVIPVIVAGVALVAGLGACLGPARIRVVAVAATAASLLGWGVTRWTVLTKAVLPTTLSASVDRGVTAAAIGVGLGLAGLLVARPVPQARVPAQEPPDPAVTANPTA